MPNQIQYTPTLATQRVAARYILENATCQNAEALAWADSVNRTEIDTYETWEVAELYGKLSELLALRVLLFAETEVTRKAPAEHAPADAVSLAANLSGLRDAFPFLTEIDPDPLRSLQTCMDDLRRRVLLTGAHGLPLEGTVKERQSLFGRIARWHKLQGMPSPFN